MVGMRIADVQEDIDHELISKEEISDIINCAAAQASEDYRGKNPLLVCVLKGAVNTLAAFSQAMSIPVQMDFIACRATVPARSRAARSRFVRICPRMCEDAMC